MILCCWSSNARLSQRILKLQMPTAKAGYRAPKRKAQCRTQPPFFFIINLYMNWSVLTKLRKRRLHFSPRSIGGLGVVLRTAFLFKVQTTRQDTHSALSWRMQSQSDRKHSKSYWKDDETALCGVCACQEPKILVMRWSQTICMKLFRWGPVREGSTRKKQIGIRTYECLD